MADQRTPRPDDELDRLRALLSHAHETSGGKGRQLFQAAKRRIAAHILKKAVVEPSSNKKKTKKDAA